MKFILIEPRGFCFGVKNALEIADTALAEYTDRQIYIYNEIVHNKTIVNRLKARGVIFTQNHLEVPDGAVVIFSAHGVSPKIRSFFMNKNLMVVDATCHLVEKVHAEVQKYTNKGYHIIYIGNPSHDEAIGVVAEAPDQITVVQTEADIDKAAGYEKYMVLNQTTLNMFDTEELRNIIASRLNNVEFPKTEDICFATSARQQAVKEYADKCDAFIVIGSANSSNSKKLKEISESLGAKSVLVDEASEVTKEWLKGVSCLCVTAGASAPEYLVQDLAKMLREEYGFEQIDG